MRPWLVLVVGAVVAVLALALRDGGGSHEVSAGVERPILALTRDEWLVRLDPRSLRPLRGDRVRLREPIDGWARSPDGAGLVIATERASRLRFFDVARMGALGGVRSQARGLVAAIAWPRKDRLWLVVATPGCCATGTTTVVVVDPVRRRVVATRRLDGGLTRVAATPHEAVLLLAPRSTIGAATLATVDDAGGVATLPLDVSAGLLPTEGVPFILRAREPGLAVDARRRRAYVLPGRPEVLEVDLRARRAQYHRVTAATSLLDRLHDVLEPRAEAQQAVGPIRSATWMPPDRIALSGRDSHVSWQPDGAVRHVARPAGLQVIDTGDWRVRTLDRRAAGFRAAHGLLLTDGEGLTAYDRDGHEAFHVLEGRRVELVATAGSLAYVREGGVHHVVDLAAGRVESTSRRQWPRLLLDPAPGPWG